MHYDSSLRGNFAMPHASLLLENHALINFYVSLMIQIAAETNVLMAHSLKLGSQLSAA
jgi:hypothetical protein